MLLLGFTLFELMELVLLFVLIFALLFVVVVLLPGCGLSRLLLFLIMSADWLSGLVVLNLVEGDGE